MRLERQLSRLREFYVHALGTEFKFQNPHEKLDIVIHVPVSPMLRGRKEDLWGAAGIMLAPGLVRDPIPKE